MKTFLLIFLMQLLSACYIFGQAPTAVQKRNTVLIDNTGIYCSGCGGMALGLEVLLESYPNLIVIANHGGCYSDARSPYDVEFRTDQTIEYDEKVAFYDGASFTPIQFYPTIIIDGKLANSNIESSIIAVHQEDSYVNIYADACIDTTTRKLTIEVECYYTSDAPHENFLNVAILQDDVFGYQCGQPGSITGNFTFNHTLRHLLTSTWGESIGSPQQGEYINRTFEYDIPEYFPFDDINFESNIVHAILEDLNIIVYVSHVTDVLSGANKYQEIETGIQAELELTGPDNVSSINRKESFKIKPNPIKSGSTSFNLESNRDFIAEAIVLHDAQGREVFRRTSVFVSEGTNTISLNKELKINKYILSIIENNKVTTRKIIVI